jgi:hypothetical protein
LGEIPTVNSDTTSDNEEKDTTNSDREENQDSENTEGESDPDEDYEEYQEDPFYHKETHESKTEIDYNLNKEEGQGNEQEEPVLNNITFDEEKGAMSNPEQDANQSSSVEPTWGTWRKETPKELENNWKVWDETNINKEETTQAYRHERCHLCDKPVSTTNMDDKIVLICFECRRTIVDNEKLENEDEAGDKGKRDRDDEEEWGGIPIPQSDDSEDDT